MGNTRLMILEEYSPELNKEAQELVETIRDARYQLKHDPEGCFGGRGNNFGYAYLEDLEARQGYLMSLGYTFRTKDWFDMLQEGIDLATVEKVAANDKGVFIYGTEGNRRVKKIRGEPVEVNWMWDRKTGEWRGEKPPAEIIATAEAVAGFYDSTLLEWRGDFHAPRVYL
jgi:hypothetical protein